MSFYYSLGHPKNPVITKYFDLYFEKLLRIFQECDISEEQKKAFMSLERDVQFGFFSKCDISYLVQEIDRTGDVGCLEQFREELGYFLAGEEEKCTYSLGDSIPGTNIKLTTHDTNKNNNRSTHPDHDSGNMIGWGEREPEEWMKVFGQSLELLKKVNKDFYDELNYIIQKIVPFNTSYRVHNSCSYKENIGVLYLGYTIDMPNPELSILEALIHESSHNKLNLIMQSEKLTLNDGTLKFYSPYRPDARHIYGVYLGVHALVPTVHTMLRAIEDGHITDTEWQSKIVLYHIKNRIGMKVLRKYADCTELGNIILDELSEVMKLCDTIVARCPELRRLDLKEIQQLAKAHFLDVQHNYPHLQY